MTNPRPRLPADTDIVAFLAALPAETRARAIATLGLTEGDALDRAWAAWAHEGQRAPRSCPDGSDWATWVIMAGRGFGKTRAGAHWVLDQVLETRALHIALVAASLDEARRVMVEGKSGLLSVADAWILDWWPSRRQLRFTNGSQATLFSGASPQALRGPEHHIAWCDELAKWDKPGECWDMLQLGLRLGAQPRCLITTTPRPGAALTRILAAPTTVLTGGPTRRNPHLPRAFRAAVERQYAGTRLGQQELDGKLLTDAPGALWSVELLEKCRIKLSERESRGEGASSSGGAASAPFIKIVIGVDPPSGDGTCGIVACARDGDGIAHVLADHSVTARTPEGWARVVADAVKVHSLPTTLSLSKGAEGVATATEVTVVAERNQGGKMVETVLRLADPALRLKLVTATHSKAVRAEPIALLFEAGRVRLHGRFEPLEAELLGMIAGGEYDGPGTSPDRADAMVWALTELMVEKERGLPRIRTL